MLIALIVLVVAAFFIRMFPRATFVGAFVLFLIVTAILLISGHG